ncbi:hypothetical protein CLV44_11972 [Marinobacterium halophilum]|uniref:Uncharacterized protein n=1 Tax=Marinobacterium halophilum TaxID=267374 RepID=A0A2P8ERW2_9GAMM|nr:hypothetical protein [Marinobacterium halophilum]PSL12237.1 hypothetical protein CLV44_11972 [Marinobacterium halophilum]
MSNYSEDKTLQQWQSYCDEVATLAQEVFGLTLIDLADKRQLRTGLEDGESPRELVERLGVKYDLIRLDTHFW